MMTEESGIFYGVRRRTCCELAEAKKGSGRKQQQAERTVSLRKPIESYLLVPGSGEQGWDRNGTRFCQINHDSLGSLAGLPSRTDNPCTLAIYRLPALPPFRPVFNDPVG